MRRLNRTIVFIAVGLAVALLTLGLSRPTSKAPALISVRAVPADALIETMGVAAKVHYASDQDYALIKAKLPSLGVRYLRDGGSGESYYRRVRELSQIGGFKWTMVMDPRDGFSGSTVPEQGILPILPHVVAVEGPNEWDVQSNLKYREQNFPIATRTFQSEMYRAIKSYRNANPALQARVRAIQVLAPSLAFHQNAEKQGIVDADMGNLHSYPGGTSALPDRGLDDNLQSIRRLLRSNQARMVATETGYCNEFKGCTGQGGIPERAAAKYANRLYLEYFLRGVYRTHLYNFSLDEWSLFLRRDGTEKPAYSAVRNFIQLLKDPGRSFATGSLKYGLAGNLDAVKSVLLQKRNGTFYLVMWLNVNSVKPDYKDIETARSITLSFPKAIAQARIYRPTFEGLSAQQTYKNAQRIALSVPDHPIIVELNSKSR